MILELNWEPKKNTKKIQNQIFKKYYEQKIGLESNYKPKK